MHKDSFYWAISMSASIQISAAESLGPASEFVDFPLDGMTFNRVYVVSGAKFSGFRSFQVGNSPNVLMLYTCIQGCMCL